MGQRIGREGAERDEGPGDVLHAEMQQSDPVVPGKRGIGDQRREERQRQPVRRQGADIRPELCPDFFTLKLPIEEEDRRADRGHADHRPDEFEKPLHRPPWASFQACSVRLQRSPRCLP